ncbi:MAG: FtsX-like permease family protein [Succinivibrio sp.]|nr:FtsX-like permease family protein [Succinivibrio sp.]
MQTKLIFKLAIRFLNSKRYGALAKFISMASTTGIGVGVCALIIGLSAMNGFEYELNNRVLSLIPGGQITSYNKQGFDDIDKALKDVVKAEGVEAAAPVITLNGAFNEGTQFVPAMVLGIDPVKEKVVIALERFMDCKTEALNSNDDNNNVILGYGIAKKLGLKKGSTINLSSVDSSNASSDLGSMVVHPFTVVGFFKTGGQIDHNFAFISLDKAKEISNLQEANTIHLKVSDMLQASDIAYYAVAKLDESAQSSSWIDTQGKLYHDINMIRQIMYLAMVLVIAVACFNIVSNLIMAVSEKRHEIAILMTMGAKRSLIVKAFTTMGVLSALKGCFYGGVAGAIIAQFIPYITANFKNWFGIELLNEDVYFINFVPSRLMLSDVLIVVGCAIVMSFIASIYPAFRASKINPALELNL